jgi:predicted dehydrogenase
MAPSRRLSRRQVLKGLAAGLIAPYVVSSASLGLGGTVAPGNRTTFGCIGVGGKGSGGLQSFLGNSDCQVVAVCDVKPDARQRAAAMVEQRYAAARDAGTYPGCRAVNDFREVVSRGDIDAVLVATPEQWHVLISIEAMKAGKDVYCEKPLGRSVEECRALVAAAKRYARVFQHGTQLRSLRAVRFACELVRNGRIGKLHTVKIGSPGSGTCPPQPPLPVPEGFDYDLWLGPAQWAPYCANRCVTPGWYWISDYCPSGFVAEYAVHDMDIAQWGMGDLLTGPVEIEGTGVYPRDGLFDTAVTYHVEYRFASGVKVVLTTLNENRHGVRFEGTDGWVFTREGIEAHPASLLTTMLASTEVRLYDSVNHERNFLDCVRSRAETICPAPAASRATCLAQVGDIAMRLRRKVIWDLEAERFVNDDEANRRLSIAMRAPWRL